MLLTLTARACAAMPDARDLGHLLHKNPGSVHTRDLAFGVAHLFWPEASPERATCALSVEIDPVGLVRGRADSLFDYVSDRPYAASSFLSVALARCLSTALAGRARERADLLGTPLPLEATLHALDCDAGPDLVRRLFAPLGYDCRIARLPLDPAFPEWGESDLYTVAVTADVTLHDLLSHLYVLIPVLDNAKHYGIGEDEVDKLLRHGDGWLATHPERDLVARRYLRYRHVLARTALDRLAETDPAPETPAAPAPEEQVEARVRLNDRRIDAAVEAVRDLVPPARTVVDLGCGEGRTLRALLERIPTLERLVGMDVATAELAKAARRLKPERHPKLTLLHGSLVYLDARLPERPDVALLTEVIEHLDPWRLATLEEVLFARLAPRRVVLTTPNAEYNRLWESLPAGKRRHHDHRFEWTRAEMDAWARAVAARHGYACTLSGIGDPDPDCGAPTQMAVFDRTEPGDAR